MLNDMFDKMWNILKEYDFQIDPVIKSKIICTSCKQILNKSYNVPCGCRYCYDCLKSYLNGELKNCLGESDYCKRELINIDKNVFIDQRANMKISKIVVKCPLESCEFKTELAKMADHMGTCDRHPVSCLYSSIGCEQTKIGVDKVMQHFHQENYCHAKLLMEFVDNLKNEVKLLKITMSDLQEKNKLIEDQIKTNEETISAKDESIAKLLMENESHKEFQKKQNEKKKKYENKLDEIEKSQEQIKTRMEGISENSVVFLKEIDSMKLDSKTYKEIISMLQTKSKENQSDIEKDTFDLLVKNQEELKSRINKMCQQNADIGTKFKEKEHEIKTLETKLTQLLVNQNCGEYLWCIAQWDETKERAKSLKQRFILSDPFYSHKNGYKMCLKLFPDGLYCTNGTYLCLHICVMRGEFDSILKWPFEHTIKIELINQETKNSHVSKIVDPKSSSRTFKWDKPVGEINFGEYIDKFIELSELALDSSLCQDNQIWIRVTVQINP